ncbi:hypothetical protein AXF42_Ash006277 [Apostasia shenzhenica]|uniref:DUF8040 domain-containing protein n=1 Tax=Apostasia shenzhenica TaxID=1088818 RepID=A0A2I0AYL7_9ASPA|nr:hypothetical protein AXF42_Ash006277 [Apostasia shenzhenica]
MHKRPFTGLQNLEYMLQHDKPQVCFNVMRMHSDALIALCNRLVSSGLMQDSRHVQAIEQLGIFMRIIAFDCGRKCAEIFQHSLETISRYFNSTLRAVTSLASEFLQLSTSSTPFCPKLRKDKRFWPYFKIFFLYF